MQLPIGQSMREIALFLLMKLSNIITGKIMKRVIPMVIPYDESFRRMANIGWGCGYVLIPTMYTEVCNKLGREGEYYGCTIPGFDDEITFNELTKIGDEEYLKLGFDTAHSYNNMENSGMNVIFAKTMEMLAIVEEMIRQSIPQQKDTLNRLLDTACELLTTFEASGAASEEDKKRIDSLFNEIKYNDELDQEMELSKET